jgi:FecR protein
MKTRSLYCLTLFPLILAVALAVPMRAAADDDDPPGRVARLSVTNGEVSFNPAGTDDWVSAVTNRPITTGDKLWTDKGARAELQVDSAAFRLAGETGLSFLNLNDQTIQLSITEGTVSIRVRRLGDGENIEVDTPNLALSLLRPGRYRVNVNEAGDTTIVSVRDGEGEVTGGGSAYTVHPGEQGYFSGNDTLDADIEGLPDADDFDNWCDERDLHEDHAVARRYVSDDVIGYEDLDDNGGWRPVPEYGTVWFPHVTIVGWAPYRYGHWAYIAPWGWTWVDDAAWGFAPFHYGRWVFVAGAWGWVPAPPRVVGVVYVRPVYAPALVAWVGGPHFGVGVGIGGGGFAAGVNVGWFPLGPREVFVPSYAVSRAYVNRVNISNTTVNETVVNNYYNTNIVNRNVNVNNVRYVNQGVPGAVTATSPHAFTSAQPVSRNLVAVNQREVASAPVGASAPSVAPPKQAVMGSGAPARVRPPTAFASRPVVARTTPPPPPPSFEKQQAAIQANHGQPISMAQTRQIQPARATANEALVKIAPPSTPATPHVNAIHGQGNRPLQSTQQTGQGNPNRPSNAGAAPTNQGGMPNNQGRQPANPRTLNDRPPSARPTVIDNSQLEQKHQRELEQLHQKQDQERQQLEQQQLQAQQKLQQQKADASKQQELNQQHQQQLEQQAQKHNQEKQQLNQKQQAEHAKAASSSKSKDKDKEDKPPHK